MILTQPNSSRRPVARRQYFGVTLIEVLVAMIVLSIGLLGIAGLQVATAKFSISSGARAATANLFADFTDRVRMNANMAGPNTITGITDAAIPANTTDTSLYAYQQTWATQQAIATSLLISTACDGSSSVVCSPSTRASYDMLAWRKRVRESMPQGAVYVQGNRSNGINVTLMWFDKDNTNRQSGTNDGTANTVVSSVAATSCETITATTGLTLQTCCPQAAAVPAGVRCNRFSFMP